MSRIRFPNTIGWHWQLAASVCAILVVGCEIRGPSTANKQPESAQEAAFDALFAKNCSGCHGADGKLGPAPPLNDPVFLAIIPDDTLLQVIRNGRPGTPMPAFSRAQGGMLTESKVRVLAEGIKPRWKSTGQPSESLPSYSSVANKNDRSTANHERGTRIFGRACAGCHGKKGEGGSAGAIADSAFLALISDQTLRRYVITGRPDLGMPSYAEGYGRPNDFRPLTSAEIDDLVALLSRFRNRDSIASNGGSK